MSLDPIFFVFGVPMLLVMAVILGVIVWVVVRVSRSPGKRPAPAWSPAASGTGQWDASVRPHGFLTSAVGTLTLAAGVLSFTQKRSDAVAWSVPAVSFWVRANPLVTSTDLTINSQPTGELLLVVNHGRVRSSTQDTFGLLSQREAAGEFIQAMRAAGATIIG